jgi:NifU-like protein involved in Fe-S cluster formation
VIGGAVLGASLAEIEAARDAMTRMLKAGGDGPDGRFEGLRALRQVAAYPARHASTLVALEATLDAVRQAVGRKSPDTRTSLAGAA